MPTSSPLANLRVGSGVAGSLLKPPPRLPHPHADDMAPGKRKTDTGPHGAKDKDPRSSTCSSLKDAKDRDRGSSKSIKHPVLDVRPSPALPRSPSLRLSPITLSPRARMHACAPAPAIAQAVTELIDELDVVHVNIAEQALEHVHSNEARAAALSVLRLRHCAGGCCGGGAAPRLPVPAGSAALFPRGRVD